MTRERLTRLYGDFKRKLKAGVYGYNISGQRLHQAMTPEVRAGMLLHVYGEAARAAVETFLALPRRDDGWVRTKEILVEVMAGEREGVSA